jgi:ribosomal protein S12 methylthiotransferase accessory factor YcaO
VFRVPPGGFCRSCFRRRYLSEFEGREIGSVDQKALALARKIDAWPLAGTDWQCVSVDDPNRSKAFALVPYESCDDCSKAPANQERHEARRTYERLLNTGTEPKIAELGGLLFSFGFARAIHTSDEPGLPNADEILGGNFYSQISGRILTARDVAVDVTTLGYAGNRELAQTKAVMEYLERYAVIEHTCPMPAREHDEELIGDFLSLYSRHASPKELSAIRSAAIWAVNLGTRGVHPVPLRFIYDKGDVAFIKPTSSGFAAHVKFTRSLIASILELVERDAFVRFWHDPTRAYDFAADAETAAQLETIRHAVAGATGNAMLATRCFLVRSPTMLPVVMSTVSSSDFARPPALVFGFGAGLNLAEALSGSVNELRTNALNLLACIQQKKGFLTRQFDRNITSMADRMNLYSTSAPRARLAFLDTANPLRDGIFEDLNAADLDSVVRRLVGHGIRIFGIDVTPRCFAKLNVYVTRAFSPDLSPLQFEEERWLNLATHAMSANDELPHFFT